MDCILLCVKYQVINITAVNTTLFFNNNLYVVYKLGYMFRPQFLVIIRPYMNTAQVIKYMEYNSDPYSLIDCCVANMSSNYFLKVQLRLKRYNKKVQ
jgi:hypothetical protein